MRPRLLDLFCGAGGASMGYHRAGFDVVGVDIEPHPSYPFEFHLADAMVFPLDGFDVVHASPPCQAHTTMSNRHRGAGGRADSHHDLIAGTRSRLEQWGGPYVIENVPGARRQLRAPVTVSGGWFGLGVERPRLFESNLPLTGTPHRDVRHGIGVYGKAPDGRRLWTRGDGSTYRAAADIGEAREAMGVPWMTAWEDVTEAIPPAYTEYLGRQLLDLLESAA